MKNLENPAKNNLLLVMMNNDSDFEISSELDSRLNRVIDCSSKLVFVHCLFTEENIENKQIYMTQGGSDVAHWP